MFEANFETPKVVMSLYLILYLPGDYYSPYQYYIEIWLCKQDKSAKFFTNHNY